MEWVYGVGFVLLLVAIPVGWGFLRDYISSRAEAERRRRNGEPDA